MWSRALAPLLAAAVIGVARASTCDAHTCAAGHVDQDLAAMRREEQGWTEHKVAGPALASRGVVDLDTGIPSEKEAGCRGWWRRCADRVDAHERQRAQRNENENEERKHKQAGGKQGFSKRLGVDHLACDSCDGFLEHFACYCRLLKRRLPALVAGFRQRKDDRRRREEEAKRKAEDERSRKEADDRFSRDAEEKKRTEAEEKLGRRKEEDERNRKQAEKQRLRKEEEERQRKIQEEEEDRQRSQRQKGEETELEPAEGEQRLSMCSGRDSWVQDLTCNLCDGFDEHSECYFFKIVLPLLTLTVSIILMMIFRCVATRIEALKVNTAVQKIEALQVNPALQNLDLSLKKISVEGAQALAEVLKGNTAVQKLDLYSNNISDEGAQALAEALKVNSALQTLDLQCNNILDEGAQALAGALKINTALQKLCLYSNNISPSVKHQIKTDRVAA